MNCLYALVGLPPDGRSDYSLSKRRRPPSFSPDGSVLTLEGFNDWPALPSGAGTRPPGPSTGGGSCRSSSRARS
jgi:hypothetical protein